MGILIFKAIANENISGNQCRDDKLSAWLCICKHLQAIPVPYVHTPDVDSNHKGMSSKRTKYYIRFMRTHRRLGAVPAVCGGLVRTLVGKSVDIMRPTLATYCSEHRQLRCARALESHMPKGKRRRESVKSHEAGGSDWSQISRLPASQFDYSQNKPAPLP